MFQNSSFLFRDDRLVHYNKMVFEEGELDVSLWPAHDETWN